MVKNRVLETEQLIRRPREEVFPFFADAFNLDRITPPWLHFRFLTAAPIAMQVGTTIEYRLRLHGIPVFWRTIITVWDPPCLFVDEQAKGPYKLWRHEHTFTEVAGGTLVRDRVTYRSRGWLLEPALEALLVGPDVRRIFAYRRDAIEAVFAAMPRS